jgi:hypothetical protein
MQGVSSRGEDRPNDEAFAAATHERWRKRQHRPMDGPDYRDAWYAQQCGGCRFWLPLTGVLGDDYGACSNPASPRDGLVQFEHDGCDAFTPVREGDWGRAPT